MFYAIMAMTHVGASNIAEPTGMPTWWACPIHIECKRVERLNLEDAMTQAKSDAKPGEFPTVFHRKNHCEWLVTMSLEDWMQIYREFEAGKAI